MRHVIALAPDEYTRACAVGTDRRKRAVARERGSAYGCEDGDDQLALRRNQIGAVGEYAMAKWLGIDWNPGDDLDSDTGDVAGHQVRATTHEAGCLILHPTDADDHDFTLALVGDVTVTLAGWCFGRDGKRSGWWRTDVRHPCFMVPQHALRPMPAKPRQGIRI